MPSASARAGTRKAGEFCWASGTKQTPSAKRSMTRVATSTARRVLPMPPGPMMVSRRQFGSNSSSPRAVNSPTRPMNGVGQTGNAADSGRGVARSPDTGPSRSRFSSPRATRTKVTRLSGAISSAAANSAASSFDGRRSPVSILRSPAAEHPARCASSACVRSSPCRRNLSHSPKKVGSPSTFAAKILFPPERSIDRTILL